MHRIVNLVLLENARFRCYHVVTGRTLYPTRWRVQKGVQSSSSATPTNRQSLPDQRWAAPKSNQDFVCPCPNKSKALNQRARRYTLRSRLPQGGEEVRHCHAEVGRWAACSKTAKPGASRHQHMESIGTTSRVEKENGSWSLSDHVQQSPLHVKSSVNFSNGKASTLNNHSPLTQLLRRRFASSRNAGLMNLLNAGANL